MVKKLSIVFFGLLLSFGVFAQAPYGINYQGVARASDGAPLVNQAIGLRISITQGPSGNTEFSEDHRVVTNEFGLFAVVIGQGQSGDNLQDVNWAAGNKWLQIELDPEDDGSFSLVGTQQLMSVPYALFSLQSGDQLSPGYGIDVVNNNITNTLPDQTVGLNGTGGVQISGTYPNFTIDGSNIQPNAGTGIAYVNGDITNSLPDQTVSLTGNGGIQITGAYPNFVVDFAGAVDDADADPTNEIQTISKAGNTVTLSDGGGSFTDAVNDADFNPANELQTISKTGSTVTLSNSGGTFTDAVNDSDADATNELQNLSQVLTRGNDAGGGIISNIGDPVAAGDAVSRSYLESVNNNDYAFKTNVTGTGSGTSLVFDLSSFDFDDGGVITGNQINISESGNYLFYVNGNSDFGSQVVITVNGATDNRVDVVNIGQYSDSIFLKLNAGDTLVLRVNFAQVGEDFDLEFFGFKI